jgi:hypothetical protein
MSICVSVRPLSFMGPVRCANGDYTALGPACRCKLFQSTDAIGMATPVTADDTFVIFTALDGGCHFHHALRSGPIVPH